MELKKVVKTTENIDSGVKTESITWWLDFNPDISHFVTLNDYELRELFALIGRALKEAPMTVKTVELSERVKKLAEDGHKIDAIKALREEQHLGLKEAKDAVEAWLRTQPQDYISYINRQNRQKTRLDLD